MRMMFDSIDVMTLPAGADLYAGYDDGNWPDAAAIAARFPNARVIRVTTNPADNEGDVLDVENGDATPADIPGWVARRRGSGAWPSIYCALGTWSACRTAVARARLAVPPWWVAAYPGCGPALYPTSVAHQYASYAGFGYDVSVVADYWPGIDPPPIPPRPPEDPMSLAMTTAPDGTVTIAATGAGTRAGHLLAFQWKPGEVAQVADLTDGITAAVPATPPYLVS